MRARHLPIIILLCLTSCKNDPVGPQEPSQIWPMKPGDRWYFQITNPSWIRDTLVMEATGTLDVAYDGASYRVAKLAVYGKSEPVPDYQWLYWNGPEGVYAMGGVSSSDTLIFKELYLKYPSEPGDSWDVHPVAYSYTNRRFYLGVPQRWSLIAKDAPIEIGHEVLLCYQYQFLMKPADDVLSVWAYNNYFIPGIGHIAERSVDQTDNLIKEQYLRIP